jgi:hypothetical protein
VVGRLEVAVADGLGVESGHAAQLLVRGPDHLDYKPTLHGAGHPTPEERRRVAVETVTHSGWRIPLVLCVTTG